MDESVQYSGFQCIQSCAKPSAQSILEHVHKPRRKPFTPYLSHSNFPISYASSLGQPLVYFPSLVSNSYRKHQSMAESISHKAALSVHLPLMVGAVSLQYLTGKTKVSKCGWLGEWISSEITSWKQPPIQCVEKYSWVIFSCVHQPFAVSPDRTVPLCMRRFSQN